MFISSFVSFVCIHMVMVLWVSANHRLWLTPERCCCCLGLFTFHSCLFFLLVFLYYMISKKTRKLWKWGTSCIKGREPLFLCTQSTWPCSLMPLRKVLHQSAEQSTKTAFKWLNGSTAGLTSLLRYWPLIAKMQHATLNRSLPDFAT